MFKAFWLSLLLITSLFANDDRPPVAYDYLAKPQVRRFIETMHRTYGFDKSYLRRVFRQAKLDRDTLARYTGRFKKNSTVGTWERFKLHIVNEESFDQARTFYKKHRRTLEKAARRYGVDAAYIVGFIGVESRYGTYTGDYDVLSALATLAFHPNRKQRFFQNELKHLFLFAREKGYDITKLEGSFAGAMGCVQQVPSVARKFNVDFDGDGASVWDMEDCIGSIANFMHKNGWKKGLPAAVKARLLPRADLRTIPVNRSKRVALSTLEHHGIVPRENFPQSSAYVMRVGAKGVYDYFLGTSNARILRRYNNSVNYVVAIHLIADAIRHPKR
jgi:membrane-bound lytic murein transglycosylase B